MSSFTFLQLLVIIARGGPDSSVHIGDFGAHNSSFCTHQMQCSSATGPSKAVSVKPLFRVVEKEKGNHEWSNTPIWAIAEDAEAQLLSALGMQPSQEAIEHVMSIEVEGKAIGGDVRLLRHVLSPDECRNMLRMFRDIGYHAVPNASKQFSRFPNMRKVSMFIPQKLADLLFQRLKPHLLRDAAGNEAVGINNFIRSFEYYEGGELAGHYDSSKPLTKLRRKSDESFEMLEDKDHMSQFSLYLYLNDGFSGGTTRFFSRNGEAEVHTDVTPIAGAAILLPHGTHPLTAWHAGAAVEDGVKYIIRTQVHYPTLHELVSSHNTSNVSVAVSQLSPSAKGYHPQSVAVTEKGRAVDVTFVDGATFRFQASWLYDSVPSNYDIDNQRKYGRRRPLDAIVKDVGISADKAMIQLLFHGDVLRDELPVGFLRASSQVSAKAIQPPKNMPPPRSRAPHAPLLQAADRVPWDRRSETQIGNHTFRYADLIGNDRLQLTLLQKLHEPGFVLVTNMPKVSDADIVKGENPVMEQVLDELIAPLETQRGQQHFYHTITSRDGEHVNKTTSHEYDDRKRINMHNDKTSYGSHGSFLSAFHLQRGCSEMRLVDGYRISEHLKTHHRKHWDILTRSPVGHGFMNRHYSKEGSVRDISQPHDPRNEFSLYGDMPGHIELDSEGNFKRIALSHRKRAIAELSYEHQLVYYEALQLLEETIEREDFDIRVRLAQGSLLVLNNHRLMHTRGEILERPRILSGGYLMFPMFESQLRLLTGRVIAQEWGLNSKVVDVELLLSRVSNGVMAALLADIDALHELNVFRSIHFSESSLTNRNSS